MTPGTNGPTPPNNHTPLIIASVFAFLGVGVIALIAVLALGGDSKSDGEVTNAAERTTTATPQAPEPSTLETTPPEPAEVTVTQVVTSPAPQQPQKPDPSKNVPAPAGPTPGSMTSEGQMYAEIMSRTSLTVRTGPSTSAGKVMALGRRTAVTIACWTQGEMISPGGGRSATDVWDYLSSPVQGWVADAYVDTGSTSPAYSLPAC